MASNLLCVCVAVIDQVRLPMFVIESVEGGERGDPLEVGAQLDELPVGAARRVRVLEGSDPEAVGGVHQEVAAEVVEHDGVGLAVAGVLVPYHAQSFDLKYSGMSLVLLKFTVQGDHGGRRLHFVDFHF